MYVYILDQLKTNRFNSSKVEQPFLFQVDIKHCDNFVVQQYLSKVSLTKHHTSPDVTAYVT